MGVVIAENDYAMWQFRPHVEKIRYESLTLAPVYLTEPWFSIMVMSVDMKDADGLAMSALHVCAKHVA